MLERIDELSHAGADFVVETTLATLAYARKIPVWRRERYSVSLIYVRLGSVAESMARVSKRVRAGGHGIPEEAIRRRFGKSLVYLQTIYKPIVDSWYIWESRDGKSILVESWER
jgi:predicted ABC-type ATPase